MISAKDTEILRFLASNGITLTSKIRSSWKHYPPSIPNIMNIMAYIQSRTIPSSNLIYKCVQCTSESNNLRKSILYINIRLIKRWVHIMLSLSVIESYEQDTFKTFRIHFLFAGTSCRTLINSSGPLFKHQSECLTKMEKVLPG